MPRDISKIQYSRHALGISDGRDDVQSIGTRASASFGDKPERVRPHRVAQVVKARYAAQADLAIEAKRLSASGSCEIEAALRALVRDAREPPTKSPSARRLADRSDSAARRHTSGIVRRAFSASRRKAQRDLPRRPIRRARSCRPKGHSEPRNAPRDLRCQQPVPGAGEGRFCFLCSRALRPHHRLTVAGLQLQPSLARARRRS